jgi:hypothetical protein
LFFLCSNQAMERIRGRGAQSCAVPTRFGLATREADGDWRDDALVVDGAPPRLRTSVTPEFPKSVLTFNTSPDIPFDRSLNAYRGCEHGCIIVMRGPPTPIMISRPASILKPSCLPSRSAWRQLRWPVERQL